MTESHIIKANLEQVRSRIAQACQRAGRSPEEITIVAVTKGVPPSAIHTAHRCGIRYFGENLVQEAQAKRAEILDLEPHPVWHLIGHLQTNKVRAALHLFDIIDSVDSVKLARALDKHAEGRIPVLLEVNVGREPTKSGFDPDQVETAFVEITLLAGLEVKGLMTVAPQVADTEKVRPFFQELHRLGESLGLAELSMGMSDDFEVAVEEGATMVRLGRAIFGPRGQMR